MIKHLSKISGVAAFAVVASTASAEIKLNENFSVDGYVTGAAVVTEPSAGKDKALFDSGRPYDSAKIAINAKKDAFTAKLSGILLKDSKNTDDVTHDVNLLDAYVSYTQGSFVVTGGKYLGWMGYESFDTINNDFISFSSASYQSPWATGAKVEYITQDFSTGVSVRDSQFNGDFNFKGDGDFGNDLGYEAYFLYTGVEKLKVFAGLGYQDVANDQSYNTYNLWASYDLTSNLTLVAEYASIEDSVDYSWNMLAKYAFTSEFSGAVRVTGKEAGVTKNNDTFGYGVASTYTLSKNFALKAEITKTENSASADVFSYALQGVLRF